MTTHRSSTIFVEDARIIAHDAHPGEQFALRVEAPRLAAHATPGSFAHLRCDPQLPMRRPMSVMRCDPERGWAEFLYKRTGRGTRLLAEKPVGASINVLGPIGRGFAPDPARPRGLLLGGGVGIPPIVFLAERLRAAEARTPLVLMGSEVPFPFRTRASEIEVPGIPPEAVASMTRLDQAGVASRLASQQDYAGCYLGYVTELARAWLRSLPGSDLEQVTIYACGPNAMLHATASLADDFSLPCQVCLEEFMACAVGGCAGCTVRTSGRDGRTAMRRVCVDGPVFDAATVDWDAIPD